ncbi:MAG: prepilin-type N-terminal cleavage/methylation domain-containing protein [Elusimicrobia bacterium]|nr:prepilin-type N-terminal cleavage/methylation domain-containing protein [Elusimicrobiota bacterium]
MRSRFSRSGFTLTELLVAVALFTVMVGGLAAFYGMVFSNQYRRFADLTVANGATMVRRAFDSAMGSATFIQDPSAGAATDYLTVWSNLDGDGRTPLVAGAPVQFSHLCLDDAAQRIYIYKGSFPKPAFSCGDSPAAVARMPLAGGPGFRSAGLAFYRPEPDLVQMTCGINLTDRQGLEHPAEVQMQAVATANDQN